MHNLLVEKQKAERESTREKGTSSTGSPSPSSSSGKRLSRWASAGGGVRASISAERAATAFRESALVQKTGKMLGVGGRGTFLGKKKTYIFRWDSVSDGEFAWLRDVPRTGEVSAYVRRLKAERARLHETEEGRAIIEASNERWDRLERAEESKRAAAVRRLHTGEPSSRRSHDGTPSPAPLPPGGGRAYNPPVAQSRLSPNSLGKVFPAPAAAPAPAPSPTVPMPRCSPLAVLSAPPAGGRKVLPPLQRAPQGAPSMSGAFSIERHSPLSHELSTGPGRPISPVPLGRGYNDDWWSSSRTSHGTGGTGGGTAAAPLRLHPDLPASPVVPPLGLARQGSSPRAASLLPPPRPVPPMLGQMGRASTIREIIDGRRSATETEMEAASRMQAAQRAKQAKKLAARRRAMAGRR